MCWGGRESRNKTMMPGLQDQTNVDSKYIRLHVESGSWLRSPPASGQSTSRDLCVTLNGLALGEGEMLSSGAGQSCTSGNQLRGPGSCFPLASVLVAEKWQLWYRRVLSEGQGSMVASYHLRQLGWDNHLSCLIELWPLFQKASIFNTI